MSFGGDTKNRRSFLSGVYARGSKIHHTGGKGVSCRELQNFEINHSCVSPTMDWEALVTMHFTVHMVCACMCVRVRVRMFNGIEWMGACRVHTSIGGIGPTLSKSRPL